MKKTLILAFLVCAALSINAQHVSPVTIQIERPRFDSLKILYADTLPAYMDELHRNRESFENILKEIRAIEDEIKDEEALLKDMKAYVKTAEKTANKLEKIYSDELAQLKVMDDMVDSKKISTARNKRINEESRTMFTELIDSQEQELEVCMRQVNSYLRDLTTQNNSIQHLKTNLQQFSDEIIQKKNNLKQLEMKAKYNLNALNNEIKATRAQIKANKK